MGLWRLLNNLEEKTFQEKDVYCIQETAGTEDQNKAAANFAARKGYNFWATTGYEQTGEGERRKGGAGMLIRKTLRQ